MLSTYDVDNVNVSADFAYLHNQKSWNRSEIFTLLFAPLWFLFLTSFVRGNSSVLLQLTAESNFLLLLLIEARLIKAVTVTQNSKSYRPQNQNNKLKDAKALHRVEGNCKVGS